MDSTGRQSTTSAVSTVQNIGCRTPPPMCLRAGRESAQRTRSHSRAGRAQSATYATGRIATGNDDPACRDSATVGPCESSLRTVPQLGRSGAGIPGGPKRRGQQAVSFIGPRYAFLALAGPRVYKPRHGINSSRDLLQYLSRCGGKAVTHHRVSTCSHPWALPPLAEMSSTVKRAIACFAL